MPSQKNSYLKRFLSVLLTDQDIAASDRADHQANEAQAVPELIDEDIPDWLTEAAQEEDKKAPIVMPVEPTEVEKPFVQMESIAEVVVQEEPKKVKKSPKNLKEALLNGDNFWHEDVKA